MLSIFDPSSVFERRASVRNEMDCVFSPDDIEKLPVASSLVTKGGVSTVNAHEITIITGTEAARTAIFAKMIAATVIAGGNYPFADGMTSQITDGKVLWIDSVNSMEAMAQFARDMKEHFNASSRNLRLVALAALGFDQNFSSIVKKVINDTILDYNPNLIIINDLDNLFPNVTRRFAKNFVEYLRDYVANNNAAVCAIGHNLIGKVKRTSGFSGEIMYPLASTVYRVSERSKKECAVTRVSCFKTFQQCPQDFAFVVNEHNFPQQVLIENKGQQKQLDLPDNNLNNNKLTNDETPSVNNILTSPPKFFFKKRCLWKRAQTPAGQLQQFRIKSRKYQSRYKTPNPINTKPNSLKQPPRFKNMRFNE